MVWREREIGRKPASQLGRTTESIQAGFRPYCGHHSPFDGRPIVAISRPATGFNIESGDVFEVLVPNRHMQKMIMAFNLQWALIQLLAIGGGAEALEDAPDYPEFLDEFWRFPCDTAAIRQAQALNDAMEAKDNRAAASNTESSEEEQEIGSRRRGK
ncbi:hypothetical protein B0T22DRAFT_174372 [Podospora appendiculata]|uniref:HNH nuclease domain-containing protein n=1 Tax=Podospora appendiculata TaxID=314037 RepID=A0AAE0XCA4_9PEZI|nr:hypothetical protein B0T22DRAFT_174372 [Podospora appendiculata]